MSTVVVGGKVTIKGGNWAPGESVHITVHSKILDLGSVVVNPDGTLPSVTFTVPADFAAGVHTVMAAGSISGTWQASFTVTAAGAPTPSTPPGGPKAPTGGESIPGSYVLWLLLAAVLTSGGTAVLRYVHRN